MPSATCEVSYITETHHFDEYGNPAFLPRFAMSCILRMHPNLQHCFFTCMAMLPGKIRITAWTKSDPRTARVARTNLQDVHVCTCGCIVNQEKVNHHDQN